MKFPDSPVKQASAATLLSLALLHFSVAPTSAQTNFSGSAFTCSPLTNTGGGNPFSVHQLRPTDIRVIGAMGNSLTAGFGVLSNVTHIYTAPTDFRGLSWSAGGDLNLSYVTTLPNILRQYNPNLYGYSTETTPTSSYLDLPNTRLNVARTGAHAEEMLGQAQVLVQKMRASDNIDFDNDWKLVTILIGSNDICQLPCVNDTLGEPDIWIRNISNALDYLQDNLPRTFVNLVQLGDINSLQREIIRNTTSAQTCRSFFAFVCQCSAFGPDSIGDQFDTILMEYQQNLRDLVGSGRYDVSDDFTVVLQPFLSTTVFQETGGETDISSFAADCSHLSATGNRDLANSLWNNMFERVGEKSSTNMLPVTEITCPSDDQPFFFTARNSMVAGSSRSNPLNPLILLIVALMMLKVCAM